MKEPKPWVLPALEWGPLLLFFAVFMLNRGNSVSLWGQDYTPLVFATLVFIPALALATLIRWRLTGHLSPMQIATLLLVGVFLLVMLRRDRRAKSAVRGPGLQARS